MILQSLDELLQIVVFDVAQGESFHPRVPTQLLRELGFQAPAMKENFHHLS